ncbi:MAG: nicotinate-nucleotide--dimethylbenzimidazole phosphoribosyltransferase [Lachnospiraceae bacterium]|nr:nicotinate-nucleotide--dimethylbenzimidazole phosphoribosyltransferase [Lachnospiraceae bacterium]
MTKEEILSIELEKPDPKVALKVRDNWDKVAKPLDGLGKFERLIARIGAITGKSEIDISKKAVIVMCADNGIVEEGISQSGQEVTFKVAENIAHGSASVCRMAGSAGAGVLAVDIGINSSEKVSGIIQRRVMNGTRNFVKEPAMSEEEAAKAISVGIDMAKSAVKEGYNLLAVGEMGIGNTTTAGAVALALLDAEAEELAGRGAGLDEVRLKRKRRIIEQAVEKYSLKTAEPFEVLRCVGGLDIAGIAGVYIGSALCHVPVVIDGAIAAAAALIAERMLPGVKEYMLPSHVGREKISSLSMRELGFDCVLDADLALGEGTGAVMLFPLLDMALAVYNNRTTFDDLRMEEYKRF